MAPNPSSGRFGHPWLTWGAPIAILVLLVAAAGGIAARSLLPPVTGSAPPSNPSAAGPAVVPRGDDVVVLSPGAADHPDHETVRWLLQFHFGSINQKRYDQWKTTVVSLKVKDMPERRWRDEYGTTQDRDIHVYWIETGPDQALRVMLSFTSLQDPKHGPPGKKVPCLRWHVTYPLVHDPDGLRLDTTLPGSSLSDPC